MLASAALAQNDFANHPLLPSGYSSIKVFDNRNRFVGRILPDKRYWVPIERIPAFLQKAVVAVEDTRFYEHGGIDIRGIARALMKDVAKGRMAEGGSTITQQLIKNRYLSGVKTIERKLDEARMAMEFEKKYSKKQILEMYFNEIYYGNGAWGIAQAARLYFDKNPEELSDAECAQLAGVQKNPARYNPLGKAANVTGRRDVVLKRMVELNIITPRQSLKLRTHPSSTVKTGQAP
ncbi:MAG: transglycosylase domain-containing protein, partial [Steroidobacteraceae bacterium]|nr:transglycosylase domain-containing protein [Deltaproteobacteria bacterium]